MFYFFFAHENLKMPVLKVAHNRPQFFFQYYQLAQIQPKSQFRFYKHLPPRDISMNDFDNTYKSEKDK